MGNIVNLRQLMSLAGWSTEFSNLGDDYLFTHITSESLSKSIRFHEDGQSKSINGPVRVDGLSWILCLSGRIDLEINLVQASLSSNCLAVIAPSTMVELTRIDSEGLDCYMLFVSSKFIKDINFDLNVLGSITRIENKSVPENTMQVTPEEASILRGYFKLLHHNSADKSESIYTKSEARSLIAALAYQMMQMVSQRLKDIPETKQPRSRRTTYVSEFMRLVHEHHSRERSLGFYAEKLFISPKYLSIIIKEHTGKSATEVIDSFVILEAKNMLRFSGKNIQQIAYELNFPNQSSFGKYFKHLTGLSPSEYQKS